METPEQKLREDIANMFILEYLPKVKEEVIRFNEESISKHQTAISVSEICGQPIGIELGLLNIAKPTNEIIDKLVKYVRVRTKQ